ncbi:uncharacterized protein LOC141900714 [Tubulanus polymorphus]|uniref:uncharacterized protein LOC141900714 n=1 Tax=Tubulanus polymorphus TaxID=672921 RepID=UPI003DA28194
MNIVKTVIFSVLIFPYIISGGDCDDGRVRNLDIVNQTATEMVAKPDNRSHANEVSVTDRATSQKVKANSDLNSDQPQGIKDGRTTVLQLRHRRCENCGTFDPVAEEKRKPITEPPENSHLIILPLLALLGFIVLICFRCCHWTSRDVKDLSVIKETKPKKTLAKGLLAVHLGVHHKHQARLGSMSGRDQLLLLPFLLAAGSDRERSKTERRDSHRSQKTTSTVSRNSSSVGDYFKEKRSGLFSKRPSVRSQKRVVEDFFGGPAPGHSVVKNPKAPSLRRVNSTPWGKRDSDVGIRHNRSASFNKVRFEKRARARANSSTSNSPLEIQAECHEDPCDMDQFIKPRPIRLDSVDACVGTDAKDFQEPQRTLGQSLYMKEKMLERVRSAKIRNRRQMMHASGRQRHSAPDGMFASKRSIDEADVSIKRHRPSTEDSSDGLDSELSNSVFLSNEDNIGSSKGEFTFSKYYIVSPTDKPPSNYSESFSDCLETCRSDVSRPGYIHSICTDRCSCEKRLSAKSLRTSPLPQITDPYPPPLPLPTTIPSSSSQSSDDATMGESSLLSSSDDPCSTNNGKYRTIMAPNSFSDRKESDSLAVDHNPCQDPSPISVASSSSRLCSLETENRSQGSEFHYLSNLQSSLDSPENEESEPLILTTSSPYSDDYDETNGSHVAIEIEPFLISSRNPSLEEPPKTNVRDFARRREDFKNNNSRDSSFYNEDENSTDGITVIVHSEGL